MRSPGSPSSSSSRRSTPARSWRWSPSRSGPRRPRPSSTTGSRRSPPRWWAAWSTTSPPGGARPRPQPAEGVTYAAKIDKAEGRLDWTRPAHLLERQLRALNPWPGCWTELGGQRLRVLAGEVVEVDGQPPPGEVLDERLTVACGEDALRLTRLQRAGGRPLGCGRVPARLRPAAGQPARCLMPRYKLVLEYDGGPYQGWQRQNGAPTVQASLEAAVLCFCGEQVQVTAAGRTDAGVHASGQVAHLDLAREVTVETLRDALNHHLRPQPVVVVEASAVSEDFHARFSARMRHYRYRIVNRRAPLALARGRAWQVPRRLDAETMHEAAQHLVGQHDFTSFRSALCQAQVAGQDARPAHGGAQRRARSRSSRRRARSCTTRCATWSAR